MLGKCKNCDSVTDDAVMMYHLESTRGHHCEVCIRSEWNNKPIDLLIDYVNGNLGDTNPNNVRLLCPNCYSQTGPVWRRGKF